LAIGLTPQLLPAIISVNLSHGAKRMVRNKVIVKRLAALENLGSMNILCSDKTGTLTIGTVRLESAIDTDRNSSNKVLLYSYLNAAYETAFMNPIDKAIKDYCADKFDIKEYDKIDEIPYDFIRKRLSVLVSVNTKVSTNSYGNENSIIITKGALDNVLEICSNAERYGKIVDLSKVKQDIYKCYEEIGKQGFRILGLCYKNFDNLSGPKKTRLDKQDEIEMTFLGFIVFSDPIKNDVIESYLFWQISLRIIFVFAGFGYRIDTSIVT
jgi:Mg2+-importing ATPase